MAEAQKQVDEFFAE
ncbi:MAG: hypothetical protein ACLTQL_04645 [Eisenbergiella sp.]